MISFCLRTVLSRCVVSHRPRSEELEYISTRCESCMRSHGIALLASSPGLRYTLRKTCPVLPCAIFFPPHLGISFHSIPFLHLLSQDMSVGGEIFTPPSSAPPPRPAPPPSMPPSSTGSASPAHGAYSASRSLSCAPSSRCG